MTTYDFHTLALTTKAKPLFTGVVNSARRCSQDWREEAGRFHADVGSAEGSLPVPRLTFKGLNRQAGFLKA